MPVVFGDRAPLAHARGERNVLEDAARMLKKRRRRNKKKERKEETKKKREKVAKNITETRYSRRESLVRDREKVAGCRLGTDSGPRA